MSPQPSQALKSGNGDSKILTKVSVLNNSSTTFHKQAAALLDGEKPDECCMPVVAGVLWPADSCVGIVESRLQCPTIHHYTLSLPLCSAAAFFPPDHWPLDRTLTTGVEKLSQLKLLPPAVCLLLTEKWIIMTDIRQQRQVLRKCGGGSSRGSVRKESKGMETRKSETHAACCNNMQYIT